MAKCFSLTALDAYVLLEVYEELKQIVAQKQLNINMEPPTTVKTSGSKKSRREKLQHKVAEKPTPDIDVSDRVSIQRDLTLLHV